MLARMFSGNPFLKDIYSTHSWFNHCAPVVDSMPQHAILRELYQLLCSVNNWELGEEARLGMTSQGKICFLRFSNYLLVKQYNYGIKIKIREKVTTTMVDFNNKVLNNYLIDTSIWIIKMTAG